MLEASVQDEIHGILRETDIPRKLHAAEHLVREQRFVGGATVGAGAPRAVRPGRPAHWTILPALEMTQRPDLQSPDGRFQLMHSVAHIEVSAVELALMAVADFPDQESGYYRDMLSIAGEEVEHAWLLWNRLGEMGGELGQEPVHLALWETAAAHSDLAERLAVVPRILEAKGLDVSAKLRGRLRGARDVASAEVLDRVYHDEIGHVRRGTHWYRTICHRRGLDPESHFIGLAEQFRSTRPIPFDRRGREKAGFTKREMEAVLGRELPDP